MQSAANSSDEQRIEGEKGVVFLVEIARMSDLKEEQCIPFACSIE